MFTREMELQGKIDELKYKLLKTNMVNLFGNVQIAAMMITTK